MEVNDLFRKMKNRTPSMLGREDFAKYAILLPLIQTDNEIHILFEVRSLKLRRQPGEICFPGGKIDPNDQNEQCAAIRETLEELGISKEDIAEVFPLDYLISPFGMILYPFVGFIKVPAKIKPNPSEVEEIFTVPLAFFLEHEPRVFQVKLEPVPEEDFPYDLIVGGENYRWQPKQMDEFFYLYEDRAIWGLTAKILSHFIDLLRGRKL